MQPTAPRYIPDPKNRPMIGQPTDPIPAEIAELSTSDLYIELVGMLSDAELRDHLAGYNHKPMTPERCRERAAVVRELAIREQNGRADR